MSEQKNRMYRYADYYAKNMGLRVFPCNGKTPATAHGCKDATADPAQIAEWWGGGSTYNVAIATGTGLLLHGAENGLHLRDLSQIVGADPRIVRQMIHNERRQGTPILSNSKDGYYLPACEDEKEACVRQMRSRAREILAAAAGIERGGR